MLGTVERIERDLVTPEGFVYRYRTESGMDGLEGEEYTFVMCTFWLVEQYANSGRLEEAEELMASMVGRASDLGLLAEQYATGTGRMAGNFPQAFSHMGVIRAADAIKAAREARSPRQGEWPRSVPAQGGQRQHQDTPHQGTHR